MNADEILDIVERARQVDPIVANFLAGQEIMMRIGQETTGILTTYALITRENWFIFTKAVSCETRSRIAHELIGRAGTAFKKDSDTFFELRLIHGIANELAGHLIEHYPEGYPAEFMACFERETLDIFRKVCEFRDEETNNADCTGSPRFVQQELEFLSVAERFGNWTKRIALGEALYANFMRQAEFTIRIFRHFRKADLSLHD